MDISKSPAVGHFAAASSSKAADPSATASAKLQQPERLPIFSIAAEPTGKRIATGALDGSIRIWRVQNDSTSDGGTGPIGLAPLATMTRHTGAVMCLAWGQSASSCSKEDDETLLASGSDDRVILVWKRRRESLAASLGLINHVSLESTSGTASSGPANPTSVTSEDYAVVGRLVGGHTSGKITSN